MAVRSLNTRLVLAVTLSLIVSLSIAGWVLDRAFHDTALDLVYDRLQAQVYMLLGAADLDDGARLQLPDALPDPRLSTPASGLYAQILGSEGEPVWTSRSLLNLEVPPDMLSSFGQFEFSDTTASDGTPLFSMSYAVLWEISSTVSRPYTVQVAEGKQEFNEQLGNFRRRLTSWFVVVVVALVLLQLLILRWGLRPIREVAHQVQRIETGRQLQIEGDYPVELSALTVNLNALIRNSTASQSRYRNALGDLAHSLKTPLAVLRSGIEASPGTALNGPRMLEQLEQLDDTIEYQLQKAAAAGRTALSQPLAVRPELERLLATLHKVHEERGIDIGLDVPASATFFGDKGDLYEVVGNLMDNACKWARQSVLVQVEQADDGSHRPPLVITVSDDGPGIPRERLDDVLRRGARADQQVAGHGIGLAIVRELVEDAYNGSLSIESGAKGTAVTVRMTFL
ncbi:MAG: HAMP domain-containing protein [Gammaproteobacteria bacterium]|nr:HAMP domain-containing protein [Gammaproteobacteria bacterium]NNM01218.1 HAMP domain-containing protein [Gammaproteobacteria bacterium]